MVRSPDTVCIGKLAGTSIAEVREIVPHALEALQLSKGALRPVRLNEDELFVSVSQGDKAGEMLCCFDREGQLLACCEGDYGGKADWAVTENYILQSSGEKARKLPGGGIHKGLALLCSAMNSSIVPHV